MLVKNGFEYYVEKRRLLKELLSLSEELYSFAEDFDEFPRVLDTREALIQVIHQLDIDYNHLLGPTMSQSEKEDINEIISLITKLDRQVNAFLALEKDRLAQKIKGNAHNMKVAEYASASTSQNTTSTTVTFKFL